MTIDFNQPLRDPHPLNEDVLEGSIRPRFLREYIGQTVIREQLQIFIQAAQTRADALDHVLLSGPPGLGKTTLAQIIARELGVNFKQTSGPILEKAGDLAALLTQLEPRDVLFIDEIHRLSAVVEEVLYPAMEDRQLDLMLGEGPSARSIRLDLAPFTLIGATTRSGLLTAPLRDRFGISQRLEFYSLDALSTIVTRTAGLLGIGIVPAAADLIASAGRGTPRIANRLLRRVRDFVQVAGFSTITQAAAQEALQALGTDTSGLDAFDRRLLKCMIENFSGGPVGLDNLAAVLQEDRGTLEEVIEPFLLQQGYLIRTARGRVLTHKAYTYCGLPIPNLMPVSGETQENES